MDAQQLKDLLKGDWSAFQDCLKRQLGSDVSYLCHLNEEVLSHAGKQLRPLLSLLMARACAPASVSESSGLSGLAPDAALSELTLRYAVAGELLHNATLLHDDVADASDLRRGRPTVRSLFGADVSVLLGDYWLSRAVDAIVGTEDFDVRVIRVFTKTLRDLAEGEMLQLEKAVSGDTDESAYLRVSYAKTASLFEACAVSGACSVGSDDSCLNAAAAYARNIGLAFQIRDDIFDYSPEWNTGKPSCEDIVEKKITLPVLGAFIGASHRGETELRAAIVQGVADIRERMLAYVREHKGIEYAQRRLEDYLHEALAALAPFPDSIWKEALRDLALFIGDRKL